MEPVCHFISYANGAYREFLDRLVETVPKHVREPHTIYKFGPGDIDADFRDKNSAILDQSRGNGYWLWKPYFINRIMEDAPDGDFIFYCDAGCHLVSSITPLLELAKLEPKGITSFETHYLERVLTKRLLFEHLGLDLPTYYNSKQRLASYVPIYVCAESRSFVKEWLKLAQDPLLITDAPSPPPLTEYDDFFEHRHDQSIFSLLCKKYNLTAYPDPSQWGNNMLSRHWLYPLIIYHTRNVKPGSAQWYRMKAKLHAYYAWVRIKKRLRRVP